MKGLEKFRIHAFLLLCALLPVLSLSVYGQEIIPLYEGGVPGSKPFQIEETGADKGVIRGITNPTLQVFLPAAEKANGAAVIIVPGGGYSVVVYNGEGVNTAKLMTEQGFTAFVLKYRLPSDDLMNDKKNGPLQDAQQAIKFVRENASKWGLKSDKIGIMGFSAGGHLASTAATHYTTSVVANPLGTSLRPDFQVLVYPVISMTDGLAHKGSRDNLLGKTPSEQDIRLMSNELQVTAETPPAYLTHTADDRTVDVDNSIAYFEALRKAKVDVEMHIYPKGDHGFIFRHKGWEIPLFDWMRRTGIIDN